ncbi:MAG: hypothetical protein HQ578_00010 [Chloroflexi bacterium]|nr:hypothetical protein [Chloroflexota bacterium]
MTQGAKTASQPAADWAQHTDCTVDSATRVDLETYIERFQQSGEPQAISFRREYPWIRGSDRYTHLIHRYPAKLLPHIPAFFLASCLCPEQATILDPFAGSGTVLLEAMLQGHNALGVEINPVARLIAKVKTTVYETDMLVSEADRLLASIRQQKEPADIPSFPNRDLWFSGKVQLGLTQVRKGIEEVGALQIQDFFWLVFSSLVRRVALADPRIAPPVLLKPEKFPDSSTRHKKAQAMIEERRDANVPELFEWAINEQLRRFRKLEDEGHRGCLGQAKVVWDDARALAVTTLADRGLLDKPKATAFPDESVDLVVTSPPYLNAQKYARSCRLEWYWLGLGPYKSLRAMDSRMLGSERLLYEEYVGLQSVGHPIADRIIEEVYQVDRLRACMISHYYQDMSTCMAQIHKALKKGGFLVLVVGNNRILKERVANHLILKDLAIKLGFHLSLMLVDGIHSRGLMTKRNSTADVIPDEWILVLKKQSSQER